MEFIDFLTVPPLSDGSKTAVITRWLRKPRRPGEHSYNYRFTSDFGLRATTVADIRTDEFEEGEVLAELSTGDVIHAPCAGYLEWCIPAGKMVRVDGELGVVVP